MTKFSEIFQEYYTLFRGQDVIPDSTDPEWKIALNLANTAIRTWDRADGTLWQELFTTATQEGETITLASGTSQYDGPSNMRIPAKGFRVGSSPLATITAGDALNVSSQASVAYWTGGANKGWTLNINGYNGSYDGQVVDFTYYKKPTLMTGANSVPEMSDPNYIVQKMVALRSSNERNGFVFQTADRDATLALQNMVLENSQGPNELNFLNDGTPGFGNTQNGNSFFRT